MRESYAGKSIVLTGASSGIGRALALELAGERPPLALAARDETKLDEVAALCRERGAGALVVPTDVTDEAACRALVERAVAAHGGIDALVLNAGVSMWARFDEITDLSIFERLMRVNYHACVWLTAAALPHLRRTRGQIVGVASLAGLAGIPTHSAYAASKHALIGFLDSLRVELHGSGVAVTVVAPDFVLSEIHRRALGPDGRALGKSPLQEGKIMTAERCAREILRAMRRRQRLAILSWRGRVGRWIRLLAPGLIDGIARRAVERGR